MRLVQAHCLAKEWIQAAGNWSKEWYNAKRTDHTYLVADLVWMFTPKVPRGHSKKLKLRWHGLYHMIEICSALVYVLQHMENPKDIQVMHISRLKPHWGGDTIDAVNMQLQYTYPLTGDETVDQSHVQDEQKEIEAILGHRQLSNNRYEVHVRYQGFTAKHNEWVAESNVHADTLVQQYWQAVQLHECSRPRRCKCSMKRPGGV